MSASPPNSKPTILPDSGPAFVSNSPLHSNRKTFESVVSYLEALSIMPKTMPGLEKLRAAVEKKAWFKSLDPKKIITVAGTNGKGTTCATLETLLIHAGKTVGLFTSPHLIQTTERIRIDGVDISEDEFVDVFAENQNLIERFQLTHFEALTLMAADFFYSLRYRRKNLDFVVWEVGLGGTFDATNVFPNHYSIITSISKDHENILGTTLPQIAGNKFGIVKNHGVVIYHPLNSEVLELQQQVQEKTKSTWVPCENVAAEICKTYDEPIWTICTRWGKAALALVGQRAVQNTALALTAFEQLGFSVADHLHALQRVKWPGRMQKIDWRRKKLHSSYPLYLSGDHNPDGVRSLLDILQSYTWSTLHLIVGVGVDKDGEEIFNLLLTLPRTKIYLTETPFKGRKIGHYSQLVEQKAYRKQSDVIKILDELILEDQDKVIVTGSLYLVGAVLKELQQRKQSVENIK